MILGKKERFLNLFITGIFLLMALLCVLPVIYILSASFSDEISLTRQGFLLSNAVIARLLED